jgi:large subunit ribosomal protein L32
MAVPKRKTSSARRDKRRNSHWKLILPGLVACPRCGAAKRPHRVCKTCGEYDGRTVVNVEDNKKKD